MFKIRIYVKLKSEVLDTEGQTIETSLKSIGFKDVLEVKTGKFFDLSIDCTDKEQAHKIAEKSCRELLVNSVIENYSINFIED